MNDSDITSVLDRLVGGLDGELGDWDDVLERSARPVRGPERRRRRWHPGRGVVLLGVTVAVAALAVLIATLPWRGGPTILDRAAAAILTPTSGKILYESIVIHPNTPQSPNVVIHVHVWLAGAPPHRFRATHDGPRPADTGGTLGGFTGLSYDFSGRVLLPVAYARAFLQSDLDPAAYIGAALTSGRAQLDGKTTIGGHEVMRIRVSWRDSGRLVPIALYFVDAHTYRPVRIAITADRPLPPGLLEPLTSITNLPFGGGGPTCSSGSPTRRCRAATWFHAVYDFSDYRYLPATAANRKLTSVRAEHPHAKII